MSVPLTAPELRRQRLSLAADTITFQMLTPAVPEPNPPKPPADPEPEPEGPPHTPQAPESRIKP